MKKPMQRIVLASISNLICWPALAQEPAPGAFSHLMTLTDNTSGRISSFDRTGANQDFKPIAPGETLELASLDGAGIIHCLEAARLLVRAGLRPRRTIRVVFFMNEENGLRGAEAYARQHGGERHAAAIESDRGGFEPRGFTSDAKGGAFERYKRIVAALAPFEMGTLIAGGGGADIQPLARHGVPLFGLLPAWHRYFDYHHSERDTIDAVNERELQMGAVALAYLAWALAE